MSECHGEIHTCSNRGCTRTTFSDLCAYCNAAMQIPTIALFGLIELQLKLAGLTLEQYLKMAGIVTDHGGASK